MKRWAMVLLVLAFFVLGQQAWAQDSVYGTVHSLRDRGLPVRYVAARQFTDDLVRISWSMHDPMLFEDFETGDFSRFPWNNNLSDHPWAIDTVNAYEGESCMKSTCEGVGSGFSQIEVSVYVPLEGISLISPLASMCSAGIMSKMPPPMWATTASMWTVSASIRRTARKRRAPSNTSNCFEAALRKHL